MSIPTISLEYFPPKTEKGRDHLIETVADMAVVKPSFMTVTYGAGGSTRAWTQEMAVKIQERTDIPTAAHLTCINVFKQGIHEIANDLWEGGIKHIIALRGDVPHEDLPLEYDNHDYYHYANELVSGLKDLHDFEISVAAYPEKHPEAPDMDADIENLKRKCEAGATRAITQFFFENETYYEFVEKARAAGITTPIVPGLLPIGDFDRMLGFAAMCQTKVPVWLHEKFRKLETGSDDAEKAAQEVLTHQMQDLIDQGIDHIHIYTLNKKETTIEACRACGIL